MARIPGLPSRGTATVGRPPRRVRALQSDHLGEHTMVSRLVALLATGLVRLLAAEETQGEHRGAVVDFPAGVRLNTPDASTEEVRE